jgi:hypothetical protein
LIGLQENFLGGFLRLLLMGKQGIAMTPDLPLIL